MRYKFKVYSTSTIVSYSKELEPLYIVLVYEALVWKWTLDTTQTPTC